MPDRKDEEREKYLSEFKERYQNGLNEFLDNLEILGPEPLSPDPASLDMNDTRDFEELDKDEIQALKTVLFRTLGIDNENPQEIRNYRTQINEETGVIGVKVIRTNREGVFLHEMMFSDKVVRWAVGENKNI